jgi:hypothetical protein
MDAYLSVPIHKMPSGEQPKSVNIGRYCNTDTIKVIRAHNIYLDMDILIGKAIRYQNCHLLDILASSWVVLGNIGNYSEFKALASGDINLVTKIVDNSFYLYTYRLNVTNNRPISIDYIEYLEKKRVSLYGCSLIYNALEQQDRTLLSYVLANPNKYKLDDLVFDSGNYKLTNADMFDTLLTNVTFKRIRITKRTKTDEIDYFLRKGYTVDHFYYIYSTDIYPPIMEYLIRLDKVFPTNAFTGCVITHDMVEYEHKIEPNLDKMVSCDSSAILLRMLDNGRISVADVVNVVKRTPECYLKNGLRQLYLVAKLALKHKKFDPILKTIMPLPAYPLENDELVGRITALCSNF